jgi:hypothetical protein
VSNDTEDGAEIAPATKQLEELVSHQTKKKGSQADLNQTTWPPTAKVHSQATKIYLEGKLRPTDDGSVAQLHREEEDAKLPTNDKDPEMQEHLSDVQEDLSTEPAELFYPPQRTVKNSVSNRELVALGSTLAPGMHLHLHLHPNVPLVRHQAAAEMSKRNAIADNMFLSVERETPEPDSVATTRKRAAPATSKNASVSKKVKTEPKKQNTALSTKREQRVKEVTYEVDEEPPKQFPTSMIEARSKSSTPATPASKKPTARYPNHTKDVPVTEEQTPTTKHIVHHNKRHTRSDTEPNDSTSTTHQDAESGTTKPKTSRLSDIIKTSRPGTPTPSVASTDSSPSRNKYGFSPMALRSRKAPAAKAESKGTVGGKAVKKGRAKDKDEGEDGTPFSATTRVTRRASAMEAKETNIGKRLRSRD